MSTTVRPALLAVLFYIAATVAVSAESTVDAARIDDLFRGYDSTHTPGLAVAVIQGDDIVYKKGFGMASLELGVPVDIGTVFRIGSVSKQFTAACIVMLARDGALNLDDPLTKHVPELPSDVYGSVTIRHMLNHTSGIRDAEAMYPLMGINYSQWYTNEMFMNMLARQKALDFQPGDGFEYSNSAYTLLAQIVERVSGEPFDEFLTRRIFEPLGMTDSRIQTSHSTFIPRRAAGYQKSGDRYVNWMTNNQLVGHDAMYSSLEDMCRWVRMYLDGTLGDDFVAMMTAPGVFNDGDALRYASGLIVTEHKGLRIWCHSGWYVGYTAFIVVFPDQQFGIVCLCNDGTNYPRLTCMKIADMFLRDHIEDSLNSPEYRASIDRNIHSTTPAETFAGTWIGIDQGGFLTLKAENGRVVMDGTGYVFDPSPYSRYDLIHHESGMTIHYNPSEVLPGGQLIEMSYIYGGCGRYLLFNEVVLNSGELEDYAGEFVSAELDNSCIVTLDGGELRIELSSMTGQLKCFERDTFTAGWGKVAFVRDGRGRVTGFDLDGFGFRDIVFTRRSVDR